jgi:hypothetical protein
MATKKKKASGGSELEVAVGAAVGGNKKKLFALLEKGGGTDRGEVNMELAREFARAVAKEGADADELLEEMTTIDEIDAPAGTAKEFLTVCGYIGYGERVAEDEDALAAALEAINDRATTDERPRIHEAATAALARMGEAHGPNFLVEHFSEYLETSEYDSFVVDALATPQWLDTFKSPEALVEKLDQCFQEVEKSGPIWDRLDMSKRLLKALGSAPAIFARKFPDAIVALLNKWSKDRGKRIPGVIAANMKALPPALAARVGGK